VCKRKEGREQVGEEKRSRVLNTRQPESQKRQTQEEERSKEKEDYLFLIA